MNHFFSGNLPIRALVIVAALIIAGCGESPPSETAQNNGSSGGGNNNPPPPPKTPPVAVIMADEVVLSGRSLQLDGSGSTAASGDPLTYHWTLVTKPANSSTVIVDPTAAKASLTPDVAGTYTVGLVVDDGQSSSNSVSDTVIAKTVSSDISWVPVTGDVSGYVIYAGSSADSTNRQVAILSKGAQNWDPTYPMLTLTHQDILNASSTRNLCVRIQSYNVVGTSDVSEAACVTLL